MLIDSHCHLNMLAVNNSLAEIMQNAQSNNIKYMLTVCTKLDEYDALCSITQNYHNVFASVGIHPNEVDQYFNINAEQLLCLAMNPKIVAVGETGLDYYYNTSQEQKLLQQKSFAEHIKAAYLANVPVIIHTRDAEHDTYKIICSERKKYPFKAVIHCFTASQEFALKMLELGIYISISGIVTFKNAIDLRNSLHSIPLSKLLIETDSPYLAPVPMRGKTNEPAFLTYIADSVSNIKNVTNTALAQITAENFQELFSKAVCE